MPPFVVKFRKLGSYYLFLWPLNWVWLASRIFVCTYFLTGLFQDAEKREVQLSDADYLDVLLALVSKGHKASADLLLSKLRKNPGYFHDAMNSLLRLLDSGADDIAYGILCSLPAPKDPSDRIGFGTLFMRKLIRYDYPASVVWNYAMDMRDKGLNPWALERLCEAAHQVRAEDLPSITRNGGSRVLKG